MEAAAASDEGEKKKPLEGEVRTKRKMKTASQLEILEKTYAAEAYPSETARAELSAKLGLSDRQLQMWFCHRRLKDRKPPSVKKQLKDSLALVPAGEREMAGNELVRGNVTVQRYFEVPMAPMPLPPMQRGIVEMKAIAFVEAQLGEPLREDGPIVGMEFDSLPPDAFGRPIVGPATVVQQKHPGRPFEVKEFEQFDVKPIKDIFTLHPQGPMKTLHEYKFLPEQPTIRNETHERSASPYNYGSPADGSNSRNLTLSFVPAFMQGREQVSSGYGFPGQLPNLNILSHQGRQSHLLSSVSGEYENVLRKKSFMSAAVDAHVDCHRITAMDSAFPSSDPTVVHEDGNLRMEKKRKCEEAKVARELEAHQKRIRKELEKQDILRRKREEQIRKEMERQDRERRKEEERLLREKQREEERYLREQRRELERREKFLLKESIRVERMRQKEEQRRLKDAARLKTANERAIARRIAKEAMELIEDERLELMELAVSSKGLPAIVALDLETLQNLDLFRDSLSTFPPKSVNLKRPFAVQPWNDSEENVGNLLMVWRFLITFADILELWPFTLDEFVQAFHDYDPRLLGEVHVALLRSISKDIEDAAKTPFTGLGANPAGGHPHIIEGAYAWGFDVRNWQRHLNALTWPEILRQFALSAGLGPQLKKRNADQEYPPDDNEGNDGKDIIYNLRSGAAVENAVARMRERGFSNPRRSRHRLTPGTVKYAAFHVLSLEGSEGLTILEVADKIQKSGLRDLTTSKTPEASISAALSRDTKLFERTAPSTYCVRAAYRKDPSDAEAILSTARERIQIFKNGLVEEEEADDAERDEERDGDSDSDVAEDIEVDDIGADLISKETPKYLEASRFNAKTPLGNRKYSSKVTETIGNSGGQLSSMIVQDFHELKGIGAVTDHCAEAAKIINAATPDATSTNIDQSQPGEPWVQGLMEGEYSDLSVDERLNALVAVLGVAVEGKSIRVVLEERLDAANALKKQMWTEAQLDKRRIKDDYVLKTHYASYMGNKTEPNLAIYSAEGRQCSLVTVDDINNGTLMDFNLQQRQLDDQQNDQNCNSCSTPPDGSIQMQDYTAGPDNNVYQQSAYAAEKSRRQLKSYIGHVAEELYVYRSLPLGQDRRRNRYWRFITSVSRNDPGSGRIFVELCDGHWRLIDSEEGFDALVASLDVRGVREYHLHSMLQRIEMSFKETVRRNLRHVTTEVHNQETFKIEHIERASSSDYNVSTDCLGITACGLGSEMSQTSTSFSIELGRNEVERKKTLRRYADYERWMWEEFVNSSILCAVNYGKKRCKQVLGVCGYCHDTYYIDDNHCPSCHKTFDSSERCLNFPEHIAQCEGKLKLNPAWCPYASVSSPTRIRLLKVLLAVLEVSVLPEALQSIWTDSCRNSWGVNLNSAVSSEDLVQILTQLECAIKRDYLSSNFETTSEFLDSSNPSACTANIFSSPEVVSVLPWIPKTTAAVALRLMELDGSIAYLPHQRAEFEKDKRDDDIIKLPSKAAAVKNTRDGVSAESVDQLNYLQESNWVDVGIGLPGPSHGRGLHGKGRGRHKSGRSQKKVAGSRTNSGKKSTNASSGRLVLVLKGQSRGRGGHKCGRRSARSRKKSTKRVVVKKDARKQSICERPTDLERDGWNADEISRLEPVDAENASVSGRSDYEENGQATMDEYNNDMMLDEYAGGFIGRCTDLQDGSDDIVIDDQEDDEDEIVADVAEDGQGDLNVVQYVNEVSEEDGGRIIEDPDEGTYPSSSDFGD